MRILIAFVHVGGVACDYYGLIIPDPWVALLARRWQDNLLDVKGAPSVDRVACAVTRHLGITILECSSLPSYRLRHGGWTGGREEQSDRYPWAV